MSSPRPLCQLARTVRRTGVRWSLSGLAICGLGILFLSLMDRAGSRLTHWSSFFFGILFCFIGPLMTLKGLQYLWPASSHLLRSLRDDPNQRVWMYALSELRGTAPREAAPRQAAPVGHIQMIHLQDRQRFSLLCNGQAAEAIRAELRAHCPHLLIGYSPEREQAFASDPATLSEHDTPRV